MSVCSTGFYRHVVLKKPWPKIPSLKELCYAKYLETDNSVHSLVNQCPFHQFPLLYDFVKNKIWYIIVHQQQIEGIFNKWDLKTHPNMTNSIQQAIMRLAVAKMDEIQVTGEQLRDIRKENRIAYKPQDSALLIQSDRQREQETDICLNNYL
ncbi:9590_t:CDS:2 [Ambispora leptoticha]|uniref:9590_t:CDS:1 n=1 Tax=Ambispora leptoticha TaxID=144679 RepID=A0A9N9A5Z2_9GLOM|nr:9590_t:CDS:2 [Ambispora leptoticha]